MQKTHVHEPNQAGNSTDDHLHQNVYHGAQAINVNLKNIRDVAFGLVDGIKHRKSQDFFLGNLKHGGSDSKCEPLGGEFVVALDNCANCLNQSEGPKVETEFFCNSRRSVVIIVFDDSDNISDEKRANKIHRGEQDPYKSVLQKIPLVHG